MDHSNQLHHACLMWTKAEHLDVNFDIAYDKIKYDDIVIKLRQQVEIMDIPLDYKNKVFDQFEEWCNKHKPNTEHIWFTTERMFALESS